MKKLGMIKTQQGKTVTPKKNALPKSCTPIINSQATSLLPSTALSSSDQYEQQALQFARHWLGRSRNQGSLSDVKPDAQQDPSLRRGLLSVPAARYKAPESRGEKIPVRLRRRFEQDFNADFSVVRIHRDQAAAKKARQEQANAFTVGAHIYFAEGMYRHDTEAGQKLLAHELTHVLQQTGRAASGQSLRATDIIGEGRIQRDDNFVDLADHFDLFDTKPTWEQIKKAYRGETDFASHESILDNIVVPQIRTDEQVKGLLVDEIHKPTFFFNSKTIKGFYLDALKFKGFHEEAYALLLSETDLPTAYRSKSFYEFVRSQSLDWVADVAKTNVFSKAFFPDRFVYAYFRFFLSPDTRPIDLQANRKKLSKDTFGDQITEEMNRIKGLKGMTENELQVCMLLAFYYLDSARVNHLPGRVKRKKHDTLIDAMKRYAHRFSYKEAADLSPTKLEESVALFASVFPQLKINAKKAEEFWQQAVKFRTAHRQGKGFGEMSPDQLKALVQKINTDKQLTKVIDGIKKTAEQIFANTSGNTLPPAATFTTTVASRRDRIISLIGSYVPHIDKGIRAGNASSDETLVLGLAMSLLAEVEEVLFTYDGSNDAALSKQGYDDERRALRIRLADTLVTMGELMGWNDIQELANNVFREGYQLALVSGWVPDKDPVKFGDASRDISGKIVSWEGTKITLNLIERYLFISYYEQIIGAADDFLKTDFSDDNPVLQRAIKKANESTEKPRRYLVYEWEYTSPKFVRPVPSTSATQKSKGNASKPPPKPKSLGELVFKHQQTIDYLATEKKSTELPVAPAKFFSPSKPLMLWIIPNFNTFMDRVAKIHTVQEAVNMYLAVAGITTAPDPLVNPWAWMKHLTDLLKLLRREYEQGETEKATKQKQQEQEAMLEAVLAALYPDSKKSIDFLRGKLLASIGTAIELNIESEFSRKREAAMNKVREATAKQLRVQLLNWDRYDRAQWKVPNTIFDQIRRFADFVNQEDQQLLQVAALLIEIGSELLSAFGPKEATLGTTHIRRYDILDILLTLAWGAVDQWNRQQKIAKKIAEKDTPPMIHNHIANLSWETHGALSTRVADLETLKKSYKTKVIAIQRTRGMQATKSIGSGEKKTGGTITSVYWEQRGWALIKGSMDRTTTLSVGDDFDLYGHNYKLHDVYENFNFYPGFHKRATLGINWPDEHRPGDPILEVNNKTITKKNASGTLLMEVFHIKPNGEEKPIRITDRDLATLDWFNGRMSDMLAFAYVGGAGNFIETMVEIELAIAELIILRGGGKAARAAIILGEILRFFASTDFSQIRKKLYENPQKVVEGLQTLLKDGAASLLNGMLFDTLPFESHFIAPDLEGDKGKTHKKPRTRMAKLLKFVADRSEEAVRSFLRLRGKVRSAFVASQSELVSRPLAMKLLEAVPTLMDIITTYGEEALNIKEALELADPAKAKRTLETQLQAIADSVLELELPEEIIPTDLTIEILIEYALRAFGVKGKLLAEIVQAARGDQVIAKLLADLLNEHDLNPNIYWRDSIVKAIQPTLQAARDDIYKEISTLVATATKNTILLRQAPGKKASLQLDKNTPELTPLQKPGEAPQEELPRVDLNGGSPLPTRLLEKYTLEFGHNFEHVRLHRQKNAQDLTRAAGAFGLTSGSHIFLNPIVNPDDGKGKSVLRHELAHVLQQTGPRVGGLQHSDAPVQGRPGGLQRKPMLEAGADRMAAAAVMRQTGSEEPVLIEGNTADGWLPLTMAEIAARVLDELVDDNVARETAESFEPKKLVPAVPGPVSRKATFKHAKTEAINFWDSVKNVLNGKVGGNSLVVKEPMNQNNDSRDKVTGYLTGSFASTVIAAIPGMVLRSIKTLGNGRIHLKLESLKDNLETYIFARSGLALNIDYSKSTSKATKITIRYLHLPYLDGRSGIFTLLKGNTEAAVPTGKKDLFTTKNGWNRVRKIIEQRRHEKTVWHTTELRFSDAFIEELVGNATKKIEGLLEVTKDVKIGIWSEYSNPNNVDAATAGLRVATHGELTDKATRPVYSDPKNMPDSARKDRQSHHIPQYLLIQYFRGGNKILFGKKNEILPGFIGPTRASVEKLKGFSIDDSASALTLDFNNYDPNAGRGDKLPAISLAAVTHQKGRLHINAASSWDLADETKGKGTQSQRIDDVFWKAVRDKTGVNQSNKYRIREAYEALSSTDDQKEFRKNVFSAMKVTYKSMYDYMEGALDKALLKYEIPYYKEVALALHPGVEKTEDLPKDYNPPESSTKVADAKGAIVQKNIDVMGEW